MSTKKGKKKVVVSTTKNNTVKGPAQPRTRSSVTLTPDQELTFDKSNYLWMGIGALLVMVGMILMTGGHMPDANTWDENLIYSTRRTVVAPIVILAGLAVEVYAIFK
ncbi:MAG: DUF3098 domain-containing protein [Bacteroidetes bacterium]|nr:MAG: DUF3098 domain-containing protein [Bacteroidota bacterium]